MRRVVYWGAHAVLAPFVVPLLVLAAVAERPLAARGRRRGALPRLVYGPTPIIAIKYMREAMAKKGYDGRTVVYDPPSIFAEDNFDHVLHLFAPPGSAIRRAFLALVGPYAVLVWAIFRFDVFHFFFDGGFLAPTPLRYLEVQLLHLAGKRVVAFPYGSDVAVPSRTHNRAWREGLVGTYPRLAAVEPETERQIAYFCSRADFVVACIVHFETLARFDLLTTHYYPIDTDEWSRQGAPRPAGPIRVVHAPNHRGLKGTEVLIEACNELAAEGHDVELRLLERVPNDRVRLEMATADIVAEQFLLGYGLTAIEGMSLGRPVLSNLSDDFYYASFRGETGLEECPIVDTTPDRIKDNLRRLIADDTLRRELGEAGRAYVLRHHSYEAVARMWTQIYRHVWHGEAAPPRSWRPEGVSRVAELSPR
jgi:glycosyltransferase involved in cell wall biosynthesis